MIETIIGLGVIGMLYRISGQLGGISVLLKEHDRRIGRLEDAN